jgi:YidC/Oxa1 family membrane protein insertase
MPLVFANIFQPLVNVFEQVLLFFHDSVGLGWGLSIIALTVTVRALLIPLTVKQFRSMRALQQHMPEMKALQEKYKDDRQRLNQEMMRFYQENSINPLASCLPLVAQLPVFISLFYMLRKDLKLDICGDPLAQKGITAASKALANTSCGDVGAPAKFLFIPDLTAKGTGAVLVVLIVLYVGSQLLSSLLTPATADKNQRMIMLALPFVFVAFIWNFPTGLLVYWITTNLWTVGQSYLIRRNAPPLPVPEPTGKGKNGDGKRKKGDGKDGDRQPAKAPAATAAAVASPGGSGSRSSPPPPPRKKKKRSGRRR